MDNYSEPLKLLAEVLAHAGEAFVARAPDGGLLHANPAFYRLIGCTEQHLSPAGLPQECRRRLDELMARAEDALGHETYESTLVRADGSPVAVRVRPRLYSDGNGTSLLFAFLEEVAENRRALEALHETELHYRIVADNTYDWAFWLSPEGVFLYSSPSCLRVTGYEPAEFQADPGLIERIVHPDDAQRYREHRQSELHLSGSSFRFRVIRRDGGIRWLEHVCQPVYGADGAFLGSRGSNRDVTERKLAEQERQRTEAALRQAKSLSDRLNSLYELVSAEPDPRRLLAQVLLEARQALGLEGAVLYERRDDDWVVRAASGFADDITGTRFSGEELRATGVAVGARQVLAIEDAEADPRVSYETLRRFGVRALMVAPLVTGETVNGAIHFVRLSGPCCFTEAQADFAGKLGAFLSLALDRSHLYRAESEQRLLLQTVTDSAPAGIAVLDGTDLRARWCNPAYLQFLEEPYRSRGIVDVPVAGFIPNAEESGVAGLMRRVAGTGEPYTDTEYRHEGFSRGTTYWRYSLLPVAGETAGVYDVMIMASEVTEQVLARQQQERYLARLQTLVRLSAEVVSQSTMDGLLRKTVDAARELTGARIAASGHGHRDGIFRNAVGSRAGDAPECPPGETFRVDKGGVYMRLIEGRESVRLSDEELRRQSDWRGLPSGHVPLRGLLGARLLEPDGGANGMIMLSDKEGGCDFTAEDEALLAQLAAIASLGLRHIRLRGEAQRRAEELDAAFAAMTDPVVVYDASGITTKANPAAVAAYGYDPAGRGMRTVTTSLGIQEEDGTAVEPESLAASRALRGETVIGRRFVLTGGDQRRVVTASGAPIRSGDEVVGAVVTWHDITERERLLVEVRWAQLQAEDLAREAQRRAAELDAAIASSADGVIIYGPTGEVLRMNERAAEMVGYSVEQTRRPIVERARRLQLRRGDGSPCPPDEVPARRALAGETVLGEVLCIDRNGDRIWLSVSAAPIRDEGGRVAGVVSILADISEMRRTQERLQQLNEQLAAQTEELLAQQGELLELTRRLDAEREQLDVTLRSIGDGVITTDAGGRVVLMNEVAERLTGWTEEEARGRPLPEVFHIISERTREPAKDPVREVLLTQVVVGLANHTLLISRDGTEYHLADSAAPIRDSEGTMTGVVLVFQDVTHQRKLEDEVARANKLESLGLLAGGIAHDFNNLLTAILGNLTLAKLSTGDDQELAELLGDSEKASLRARGLTQQLLTFARGGVPVRRVADLREFLEEACRFVLRGSAVNCRFEIADGLWPVEVDVGQISQVVQNLVINADESMPEGGTLTVRAENAVVTPQEPLPLDPGRYVRVTVADEGIGIPPEHLGRIFDPYFTTKEKGSGIGLSVCYSVVNKHDGHIAVESRVGEGTRFSIYLPAAEDEIVAGTPAEAANACSGGRVLVMDDEEVVRRVAQRMLERLGYEVETVEDGARAVAAYAAAMEAGRPFTAVILDLVVPGGMGGIKAVGRLRRIDPGVRAVVSSGYSTDPVMGEYARHGFSGVIGKPYQLEELAALMVRLERQGR